MDDEIFKYAYNLKQNTKNVIYSIPHFTVCYVSNTSLGRTVQSQMTGFVSQKSCSSSADHIHVVTCTYIHVQHVWMPRAACHTDQFFSP